MPRLIGGSVRVSALPAATPLLGLHDQLNARFADYAQGKCNVNGAPPDRNIFSYNYTDTKGAPWMRPTKGAAAALTTTERGKLETVADIPLPGSTRTDVNAGSFGPLWSHARAVRYAAWQDGTPEPAAGYDAFATSDWAALYRSDVSSAGYPDPNTPYSPLGTTNPPTVTSPYDYMDYAAPGRRVLYLPLLACDAGLPTGANDSATVVAVGKFFMTVPATPDRLIGEFSGIAASHTIPAIVELFP